MSELAWDGMGWDARVTNELEMDLLHTNCDHRAKFTSLPTRLVIRRVTTIEYLLMHVTIRVVLNGINHT